VPSIGYTEYLKLMTNPVVVEVRANIRKAELATWEKMSIIHMHCRTERTLDSYAVRNRGIWNASYERDGLNRLTMSPCFEFLSA